ncbi:MAG: gamma-glutamyltransferase family protein, partial [Candidatus Izemoplasmatales bacterium]|nr:gamma-glutamyltransferase family protein [Candidatus Izemoplasmatales bacterium]
KQATRAKNGVVATSEGLAAQAGLEILKKGGNAVDAAVATAACLTVVEPCSNGIGSDAFAIIYFKNKIYGMNASGVSSRNISIEKVKNLNHTEMPKYGVIPITVPGTPKAWASLIERFGNLSLIEVLTPAINLAREGYAIGHNVGRYFEYAIKHYEEQNKGPEYKHFFEVFKNGDNFYRAGDIFKNEMIAKTLEEIGYTNSDSFYKGYLADKIVSFMEKHGGFIDKEDLLNYEVEYVEPISCKYKGYDVLEIPPNGQGITALMAMNILKNDEFDYKDPETFHKQIEAIKIAFSDTMKYVTDPRFMKMNPKYLLSDEYSSLRRKEIEESAKIYSPIDYKKSGTVYLATADKEGNMVSYIQSNYMGFGSGIVIDDTGISMQNRGHTFSLDENHDNCLMPSKKTYHTIIPGFLMKDGLPIGPFGVMGGFMQPQGHLQVIMNMIDFKMDPQAALDAPRFRWDQEKTVALETKFPDSVVEYLKTHGHDILIEKRIGGFGNGQIILKNNNHYLVGTETRCQGHIAYY